jgi:membrane protein implicated in regulation of membrane protease activity
MKVFDAIWAFRYHGVLPTNLEAAIFGHSLKTYGWVDIVVAAILIICGFLVISGSGIARWVGIVAAVIAGISAIWWMPFYPVWSFVYIFIAALVIYALTVYGGDQEREQASALG